MKILHARVDTDAAGTIAVAAAMLIPIIQGSWRKS